jgi:hypothetical protein
MNCYPISIDMESTDNTNLLAAYLSEVEAVISACNKMAKSKTDDENRQCQCTERFLGLLISRDKIAGLSLF